MASVKPKDDSSSNNNDMASPIVESILSVAKDSRYVAECQNLILQLLLSFFPQRNEVELQSEAQLFAHILYTTLVLARTGRTLGMAACGLEYEATAAIPEHRVTYKRLRIVAASLVTTLATFTLQRYALMNGNDNATAQAGAGESLRGSQRRQYFEAQRQRMLEMSQQQQLQQQTSRETSAASAIQATNQAMPLNTMTATRRLWVGVLSRTQQLKLLVKKLIESLAESFRSGSAIADGPHEVVSPAHAPTRPLTIAAWVLRVHLAFFCLSSLLPLSKYKNGGHPTWTDRLAGLVPVRAHPDKAVKRVLVTSQADGNARMVGLLIFAQAFGSLLQGLSRSLAHWWIDSTIEQHYGANTLLGSEQRPVIRFEHPGQSSPAHISNSAPLSDDSVVEPALGNRLCAICRQPRQYPACPVSCGHVFCWKCLQEWVITRRPECPLCRSKCRSQDVVALYDYTGSIPDRDAA